MNNQRKFYLLIPLSLMFASLACFSEVVDSLLCEATGGTYLWEGPEVAFSHCDRSSRPMIEKTNAVDQPGKPTPWPDESGDQVFVGTTNLEEPWSGVYGSGQVLENEVVIIIDSQNQVFGSLAFKYQSPPSEGMEWEESPGGPRHSCVVETRITITGEPSGTFSVDQNTILITTTQTQEFTRTDCPSGDDTLSGDITYTVMLMLSGNTLTGSSADGFSFIAERQ